MKKKSFALFSLLFAFIYGCSLNDTITPTAEVENTPELTEEASEDLSNYPTDEPTQQPTLEISPTPSYEINVEMDTDKTIYMGGLSFFENTINVENYFDKDELIIPEKYEYKGVEYCVNKLDVISSKSIRKIFIPSTIEEVNVDFLRQVSSLEEIKVAADNKVFSSKDGVLYSKDGLTLLVHPYSKEFDHSCLDNVKHIGDYAFGNQFTKFTNIDLVLPNSVETIGKYSFYNSGIKKITFSDNLISMGWKAFYNNIYLTDVKLPKKLQTIGPSAFSYANLGSVHVYNDIDLSNINRALQMAQVTEITLEDDNEKYVSDDGVIYTKDYKTLVYIPGNYSHSTLIVNENCEEIRHITGNENFTIDMSKTKIKKINEDCYNLGARSKIIFPECLEEIGEAVFNSIRWEELVLPEGLKKLGTNAFANAEFKSIKLPSTLEYIGDGCFSHSYLNSIEIPKNVKYIGRGAFSNNNNMKSLVVDEDNEYYVSIDNALYTKDLKEILHHSENTGKTSFKIHESVQHIADYAFYGSSLKSIELPEGLISIGEYAFSRSSITKINLPNSLKHIGSSAFYVTKFSSINLPLGLETIGDSAFESSSIKSVTIPSSVISLGERAFRSNDYLETVHINADLYFINKEAFAYTKIKRINIPDSVFEIKESAFSGCRFLIDVKLPKNLKIIGNNAFSSVSFTSLILPEGLLSIGERCFSSIENTSIYIPSSVIKIGHDAFISSVSCLEEIIVDDNNEYYKSIDGNLYSKDGKELFYYCISNKRDSFVIPEGVEIVHRSIFSNYAKSNIKNLYIPDSVKYMGHQVFYKEVTIYLENEEIPSQWDIIEGYEGSSYGSPYECIEVTFIYDYDFSLIKNGE